MLTISSHRAVGVLPVDFHLADGISDYWSEDQRFSSLLRILPRMFGMPFMPAVSTLSTVPAVAAVAAAATTISHHEEKKAADYTPPKNIFHCDKSF